MIFELFHPASSSVFETTYLGTPFRKSTVGVPSVW